MGSVAMRRSDPVTPISLARALIADLATAVADACAWVDTRLADAINDGEDE